MKIVPPATARLKTPAIPAPPAPLVWVVMTTEGVIHDISPPWEMTDWSGCSCI